MPTQQRVIFASRMNIWVMTWLNVTRNRSLQLVQMGFFQTLAQLTVSQLREDTAVRKLSHLLALVSCEAASIAQVQNDLF